MAKSSPLAARPCRTCYTVPKKKKMTEAETIEILARQKELQQAAVERCEAIACVDDSTREVTAIFFKYTAATTSAAALTWTVSREDAGNLLEIGASYGGGSTTILARAAADRGTTVTSIEAGEKK